MNILILAAALLTVEQPDKTEFVLTYQHHYIAHIRYFKSVDLCNWARLEQIDDGAEQVNDCIALHSHLVPETDLEK